MKTNWLHLTGLGLILNFCCATATPLDNWHWRNPLPNGNPQLGAQALNAMVYATSKFVGVGNFGVVAISTDATNWSQITTATTNNINGLVYADGMFVAVGDNGVVETSPDGTNWVLKVSGTSSSLSAITYGLGKFVTVGLNAVLVSSNTTTWIPANGLPGATTITSGSNGFVALLQYAYVSQEPQWVYYSPDGLTWTIESISAPDNPPLPSPLYNDIVTYAYGTYLIGAHQYIGSGYADVFIFSSTDGINWSTNRLGSQPTLVFGFSYGFFMAAGNNIVAAGAAGLNPFLQFSSDGIHWNQTNNIPFTQAVLAHGPQSGAYGQGIYVLTGPSIWPSNYISNDGLNWTNYQYVPTGPTGPTYTFTGIASNNGVNVAVSANLVAVSSNGLSYVVVSNTPALSSVMVLSNQFLGVGPGGGIYISTNGLNWTQRTSGTANNLHDVAIGNGLLVAVGDGGAIQTSFSGLVWTSRTSGTSLALYSLVYSNGIFVAVGQQGTVLTSPDGINWTGQYSGVLSNLLSAVYGPAGFVAVGAGGTIVTSPDGFNWNSQNSGASASLNSISFGNGYYLAAGNNGVALSSPDGVNWTPRDLGITGGQNLYGSAFINSRFEVVGANGTIIESDVTAPLFDLLFHRAVTQNAFTMFATPGSNFRLQTSASLTGGWTDVTSFNNVSAITQWTNNSTGNQQFYRLVSP